MTTKRLLQIFEDGLELSDLEGCATFDFTSEAQLVSSINELSQLYVFKRDKINSKELSNQLATAYLYFYFTTNLPKLFQLLKYLPQSLIDQIAATPWIDFGSGPGTYTVAWYSWLAYHKKTYPPAALLVENDFSMQDIANKVLDHFLANENISVTSALTKKKFDHATLFFGHSCNELPVDKIIEIIKEANPKFIIFLEPGTPEVFKKILEIRVHLITAGHITHYPCLQNQHCPMMSQTFTKDWCHQYLSLKFSPSVDRLTQLASLRRNHSALIFHIYERAQDKALAVNSQSYRVVQGPIEAKGVWSWKVCGADGQIRYFESLTRQYTKDQLALLNKKIPGVMLNNVTLQKQLKPDTYRVLIGEL